MSKFKSRKGKLKTTCRWFALCDNIAVTTKPHSILGAVPICQRCLNKLKRIETGK